MDHTDQGLTRTEVKPGLGMDYFFLARATDPQHSKGSVDALVVALEAGLG